MMPKRTTAIHKGECSELRTSTDHAACIDVNTLTHAEGAGRIDVGSRIDAKRRAPNCLACATAVRRFAGLNKETSTSYSKRSPSSSSSGTTSDGSCAHVVPAVFCTIAATDRPRRRQLSSTSTITAERTRTEQHDRLAHKISPRDIVRTSFAMRSGMPTRTSIGGPIRSRTINRLRIAGEHDDERHVLSAKPWKSLDIACSTGCPPAQSDLRRKPRCTDVRPTVMA